MRRALVLALVLGFARVGSAATDPAKAHPAKPKPTPTPKPPPGPDEDYVASFPGVVTTEGAPGIFINPTSGTLGKGSFLVQFSLFAFNNSPLPIFEETNAIWHGIAAYGITDWLEVGGLFEDRVFDKTTALDSDPIGGGFVEAQMRQRGFIPEVGVGGIFRSGNNDLEHQSLFAVASWGLDLGVLRLRPSVGVRQVWYEGPPDNTYFYGAGDIELVGLHFVGEVMTEPDGFNEVPWSIGVQGRRERGASFSLGWVKPPFVIDPGVYAGLGMTW